MERVKKILKPLKLLKKCINSHKGKIAVGFAAACLYKYCQYAINSSLQLPTAVIEKEKSKDYLDLRSKNKRFLNSFYNKQRTSILGSMGRELVKDIFPAPIANFVLWVDKKTPDLAEDYVSPWSVLRDAYSRNKAIPLRSVEIIDAYKAWDGIEETRLKTKRAKQRKLEDLLGLRELEKFDIDAELQTLAKAIDPVTSVALARTHDADLRLFLTPPALDPLSSEAEIEDLLHELLIKLPQTDVEKCVEYFTTEALKQTDEQKHKREGNEIKYTRSTTSQKDLSTSQKDVELICLQALLKHSVFEDHCKMMIDNGVLELLQRIKAIRPNEKKIQEAIVGIVSNICANKSCHSQVHQSGWITLLTELSKSDQIVLRIQASRGLANLDRDNVKDSFHDGVYVLYPRYRSKIKPEADIVFVHGLMGGAFHSWRRNDNIVPDSKDDTQCWPETWLPQDLPGCRIMCVNFDTSVTDWRGWMTRCPHDKERKTISYRSRQLLDSLNKAGLGKRPIVWVTHSMGGLIVKNMMLDAEESPKEYGRIRKQTKAMIFFSTPHKGSQLAQYSRKVRKVLFPSPEVMELSQDSPKLDQLNEVLQRMVKENDLRVLSFGETQSTIIGLGKLIKLSIVTPDSANPKVGEFILADANHLNVCKPASRQSSLYQHVVRFIRSSLVQRQEERDEASIRDEDLFIII